MIGGIVPDQPEEPLFIEPVHPLERLVLDLVDPAPGTFVMDQLGLVELDDRFPRELSWSRSRF